MTDRELDAWIAEHIMGLEPWPEQRFSEKAFRAPALLPGQEAKPCTCPVYSLDLNSALKVVEKLTERPGVEFDLITHKGLWAACFHGLGESLYAEAKRPALAICLAAKQAVEA